MGVKICILWVIRICPRRVHFTLFFFLIQEEKTSEKRSAHIFEDIVNTVELRA